MPNKGDTADARIAAIARGQHGVVTAQQLAAIGLGRAAISERAASGHMHRLHRGVYAVGHMALSQEARWMAAVLACGEGAVLSHLSAAVLWGLLKPEDGPIDVSVPSQSGRRRRGGIRVHRCASLANGEKAPLLGIPEQRRLASPLVTVRHGIPATSVARTVEDLRRSGYPERWVRRALRQAELAGHRLDDRPRRRTRSDLEDDFLAFLRRHRLPLPEVNVNVGRWEVDFLWRAQLLAVETDFYGTHRGSVAFEDDHQRDLDLRRLGYRVRRYTGAQIRNHPAQVVADLGEVLGV
jgi:very-short-patch-repair endonuclease